MDRFATWKDLGGSWRIRSTKHDERDHMSLEQLSCVDSYSDIMTTETNAYIRRLQLMMHVVIVPENACILHESSG